MNERQFARLLKSNPDIEAFDDRGQRIVAPVEIAVPAATRRVSLLSEYQMQSSIFAQIDVRANQNQRWKFIIAVPNGQYREGERMEPGLRAGFPDTICCLPRAATLHHPAYCGMAMELKVADNDCTPEQVWWLRMLATIGWYTCVVRDDIDEAINLYKWYLEGEDK